MKTDMKKILIPVLSLLMAAFAVSCTPQEPDYSGMKAVLGLEVADMQDLYEVNKRQQKTVNIKVAAEAVPGTTLNITLGVNPELVAAYNEANGKNYEMLPAEAYSFVDRELMLPRFNTISSLGQLNLIGMGCDPEKTYVLPVVIEKVEGSENYEISETGVAYLVYKMLPALKGIGTKDDPYVIEELNDFLTMNDKLLSGETTYFEMTADIDLSGVDDNFIQINAAKPYNKIVMFDGNGHTISNLTTTRGIFRVFYGKIENVVFDNITVNAGSTADVSVVADYFGYSDGDYKENVARNITVKNSKCTTTGQRGSIFTAQAYDALIENVYIENCEVNAARRSGILCAKTMSAAPVTIKSSYIKGGSITGPQQIGGFIGEASGPFVVKDCGISATFNGNFGTGGIVGQCSLAAGSYTVENCFNWGSQLSPAFPGDGAEHYSSGAIVGCMAAADGVYNFKNCYYKSDFQFRDYSDVNPLSETSDISGARVGTPNYNYPYHGKAAAAGKTASQFARDLKWDETIWDLNGAEPMLK